VSLFVDEPVVDEGVSVLALDSDFSLLSDFFSLADPEELFDPPSVDDFFA